MDLREVREGDISKFATKIYCIKVLNSRRINKSIVLEKEIQNRSSPHSTEPSHCGTLGNQCHTWSPGHLYDEGTGVIIPKFPSSFILRIIPNTSVLTLGLK